MSSTQWANIGDDDGAPYALLQRVADQVSVDRIDHLWIFPPRRVAIGESIVVVVSTFDDNPDRRRVMTAHFTVARNRKGIAQVNVRFDDHASAPTAAVPRVVDGVLRRLGEEVGAEPREECIAGGVDRWNALVIDLGGRPAAEPVADLADEEPRGNRDA